MNSLFIIGCVVLAISFVGMVIDYLYLIRRLK